MIKRFEAYLERTSDGPLQLCGSDYYFVYPSYGAEFRDMAPWLRHWRKVLPEQHRFWPGFSGGGILAVPFEIPARKRVSLALDGICHHRPVYGLVLGNEAGQELGQCVSCALPDRPPTWAIKWGAKRVPKPKVAATVEHAECLNDERFLLVVPRKKRKSIKLMEEVPAWFDVFGVSIEIPLCEPSPALRDEMRDWFTDPQRRIFCFNMSDGVPNAAWQLAVVYYVAEYWDVHARGIDSVHFVATIEGKPNFRKNWTSNK